MGWALKTEDKIFLEEIKKGHIEFGSGFLYKANNGSAYILTNAHVVDAGLGDKGEIIAFLNGIEYPLIWVGGDTYYDLAVLKLAQNSLPREFHHFSFNFSYSSGGEKVIALANRRGNSNYRRTGEITQLNQNQSGISGKGGYIEHTATLVEGCSGGPLLNLGGEIIGMNTRINTKSGLGYALPIKKVCDLAESIIQNNGRVKRIYLGIELQQKIRQDFSRKITSPIERPRIKQIFPESPLKGNVRVNDYIGSIDNNEVRTLYDVFVILESLKPNESFKMMVTNDPLGESNWREITVHGKTLLPNHLEIIAQSYLQSHLNLASSLSSGGLSIKGDMKSSEIVMGVETPEQKMISLKIVSSQPLETGNDFRLYRIQDYVDLGIMLRLCSLDGKINLFCRDDKGKQKIVTTI